MKNILVAAAVVLFAAVGAQAQNNEVLTFTRIARDARTSGLAGAGSASVSSAAYASFTNAAVIPFYDGSFDVAATGQRLTPFLGGSTGISLGGSYNFGRIGVTLGGLVQLERPDYDGFRPTEYQVNVGLGYKFTSWLGAGVNARFVGQGLFPGKSNLGFNFDVLLLAAPVKGLTLTAGVANIGNSIQDTQRYDYPQPASIKFAAAYLLGLGKHGLEFMLDEDYYFFGKQNAVAAGLEYNFDKLVFARAGYRYATAGCAYPSHLGVGLGFQYWGIRLDVSYLTLSEVYGNTIAVSLGYRF